MSFSLTIHIAAGTLALIVGVAALSYRKGKKSHRLAGRLFVYAMLVMCGFGALIAYLTPNTITVIAACLTAYMVVSSWLTVRRPAGQINSAEKFLALVPLAICISAAAHGLEAAASSSGTIENIPIGASAYYFFAVTAALALIGDFDMLWRGGRAGEARIARHLWRMCFALWIATTSFFEGQARVFPEVVQESGLLVIPGYVVLLVWGYFLLNPLVKRTWRKAQSGAIELKRGG